MPAIVTCKYCKEKFDRDKEEFCQYPAGTKFRYAHSKCEPDLSIQRFKKGDVCYICGKCTYGKKLIPFLNNKLFVHEDCLNNDTPTEQELLNRTILRLFNCERVPTLILKTIKNFIASYNYTYSGIRKTLEYWYDIEKKDINKANNNINIVPYIYNKAKEYYKTKWMAERANKNIIIPQEKNIVKIEIKEPERKEKKKKKFSFLDEEV